MILVDIGPLVALFNRADDAHGRCADTLKDFNEPAIDRLVNMLDAAGLRV